jgi:nitroimidazol reductase NimA-like FMN-containing flavoprotein (pyridoxamine 5'-phosphate oxidase superfamily)
MGRGDVEKTARLLNDVMFGTLATCSADVPWVAPLPFAIDDQLRLIFLSPKDSLHSRQGRANPQATFTIYRSDDDVETFDWVKIAGQLTELSDEASVIKALKVYYAKRYPDPIERREKAQQAEFFLGDMRHMRVYLLDISDVFTMDMQAGELDDNRRVRVPRVQLIDYMFPGDQSESSADTNSSADFVKIT